MLSQHPGFFSFFGYNWDFRQGRWIDEHFQLSGTQAHFLFQHDHDAKQTFFKWPTQSKKDLPLSYGLTHNQPTLIQTDISERFRTLDLALRYAFLGY